MNIEPQDYLRLVEKARTLVFWDIETTGREADYDSVLVVSARPFGKGALSWHIEAVGNDRRVIREATEFLDSADAWVTYYGKGFDVPFMNTRLLKWGLPPLAQKPHVDMYFQLRNKLLTGRHSQAHLLEFLETPTQKMSVSPNKWSEMPYRPEHMPDMIKRCESDTAGLMGLYNRSKHLIRDIKK